MRAITFLLALLVPALGHAAASYQLLTPRSISVPGGESQDVSIRLYDASGRPSVGESTTFANDACGYFAGSANPYVATVATDANGVATVHFTASNPPGITCWITIGAGINTTVNVLTYRVNEVGMVTAPVPGEPRPGSAYTLKVTPSWGAYGLKNVDVTARVIAGTGSASLDTTTANTGEAGYAQFNVTPGDVVGTYSIEVAYRTRVGTFTMTPPANPWQDMWWVGTAENGWGLSIVQHRDVLFAVIYAYDENGKPTWFVVPGAFPEAAGSTTFSGAAYVPTGAPFYAYDTSKFLVGPPVGNVRIAFNGGGRAALDYTLNGRAGHKDLVRDEFALAESGGLRGLGDMWWGGAAQNGWGIAVLQQYRTLFIVWFTYDATGAPTWYFVPAGGWIDDQTYQGRIYRASSSPWLGTAYDASRFQSVDVGSVRIRFAGDNATLDYSLEGRSGTIPLSRTPF